MDEQSLRIPAAGKFVGPYDPIPEPQHFEPAPFTRGETVAHLSATALNFGAVGTALAFQASHLQAIRSGHDYLWPLTAVAAAVYLADLISGILHWAFDTWFSEHNAATRRMVIMVREHHVYPQRIFRYGVRQELGVLSWFGLLGAVPLVAAATLPGGPVTAPRWSAAAGAVVLSLAVSFSLQLHKLGHKFEPNRVVRTLQRLGLVLSPEHHMRHHSREHDTNYCLVNGVADKTLGRLGFFRRLEAATSRATGARPRENDRAWRRRFGRWVDPNPGYPFHPVAEGART